MKKIISLVAATLVALSLTAGVASAHSISNTGPRSTNRITVRHNTRVRVNNSARVQVNNDSTQVAVTGNARVSGNTNGGDAETGDARNTNSTWTTVHISY